MSVECHLKEFGDSLSHRADRKVCVVVITRLCHLTATTTAFRRQAGIRVRFGFRRIE